MRPTPRLRNHTSFKRAIVKYNGGAGALLCSKCRVILATGFDYPDVPHICSRCDANGLTYNLPGRVLTHPEDKEKPAEDEPGRDAR